MSLIIFSMLNFVLHSMALRLLFHFLILFQYLNILLMLDLQSLLKILGILSNTMLKLSIWIFFPLYTLL
ncbi:hypothetical protein V462_06510 [Pantoea ananatis 15320]|nr:hypothetical protein V462_06510 [Pantoea ananatis 15320]